MYKKLLEIAVSYLCIIFPITGTLIFELGTKDLIHDAYEALEKPKWAPDYWVRKLNIIKLIFLKL